MLCKLSDKFEKEQFRAHEVDGEEMGKEEIMEAHYNLNK